MAIFLSLPLYNYSVDWYGVFQSPDKDGLIHTKNPAPGMNVANYPYLRMNNAIEYLKHNTNTGLIMGSSRITSMSDRYATEKLGYNFIKANYAMAALHEHAHNLKLLFKKGLKPEIVIIGIDDLSINKHKTHTEFNRRLYPSGLYDNLEFWGAQLFRAPGGIKEINSVLTGKLKKIYARPKLKNDWTTPKKYLTEEHDTKIRSYGPLILSPDNDIASAIASVKELRTLSKDYGFKLVFFYTPRLVTTYFYRNHQQLHQFKKQLAQQTAFYDFSGVTDQSKNFSLWRENSHYTTAMSNAIIDTIASKEQSNRMWGRYVTPENIEAHLAQLKANLSNNIDSWLFEKPDSKIFPNLYAWLFDSYQNNRRAVWNFVSTNQNEWHVSPSKTSSGRWTKNKEADIRIPKLENTDRIELTITGAHKTYYTKKRSSRKLIINVNDQYYGSVLFGIKANMENHKKITILSDFSKETKITLILQDLYQLSSNTDIKDKRKYGLLLNNYFVSARI